MASAAVYPSHRRWDTRLQQRESFTTCIRNNVREYGGGSTCLKELLANADDAKATRFTICLDKSQYSTDCLLGVGMKDLQGPALWVCNDASFSNQDYHNYTRSVGDSAKANDSETVGKFGKGSLTVYSLTDVIQILSADSLLVLDPQATYLPDQRPSVFGNLVNRKNEHFMDISADSPDQLEPFLSFTKHCSSVPILSKHYPGTLFRLALRTQAAAQHSEISTQSVSPDQVAQTLQDFIRAAPDLLLFTRHVKSISVFIKDSKDSQCTLMHECAASISNGTSTMPCCKLQKAAISIQDESGCKSKHIWHKATHSIGGQSGDVAILELVQEGTAKVGKHLPPVAGKVCSTMAVPLAPTSLPVHINGAFRLSSDRRTLWAGEGDHGQGDMNKSVLIDDIAPAYAAAITSACPSNGPADDIYKKWPTAYSFQPRLLDSVTSATVEQLIANRCKVLWAPTADVASQLFTRVCTSGKWVAPSEACLVQPSDYAASAVVINVARRAGLHIPDIPSHVFQALTSSSVSMTLFGPDMLRNALLAAGNIVRPSEISEVLSYIAKDASLSGHYQKLVGLHLILLNDGSVQQIEWHRSGGQQYFVSTHAKSRGIYSLMEGNRHQLVKSCPAWMIVSNFRADVQGTPLLESKQLNVAVPTMDDLGPSLPESWQHSVCDLCSQSSQPSPDWLARFWSLMASLPDAVPRTLHSLALVPITGHRLASIQHCIQYKALGQTQLWDMSTSEVGVLSSIGCVCITEPQAERVSPTGRRAEWITTALHATSISMGVPLQQLLSQERLGSTDFCHARMLLADRVFTNAKVCHRVWNVIRQCPIFEDSNGQMIALDGIKPYGLLPAASWEEHIAELDQLLPWTPVKYHTASGLQRVLIHQHAKMLFRHPPPAGVQKKAVDKHAAEMRTRVPSLADFLHSELLPAIIRNAHHGSSGALLLQALDELAHHSDAPPLASLTRILIDGNLHSINWTVDSSSSLLQTLFSTPSTDDDYRVLPPCYSTPARLAVLKRHGLAHLSTPDPKFFNRCSERFSGMGSSLTEDDIRTLSRGLADMLHGNVDAYLGAPGVKQLHENPVSASVAKYLDGDFNNPAAYPDAVITIDNQEILVHKHVVAKACEVLGRRWDPLGWGSSSNPRPVDTSLCCDLCNIHPSYAAAVLFLEYFYTGEVKWPCQADVQTASELLVMASMYDVQHLVCIAEMALEYVLDVDNCCAIFAMADHHGAVQLRARCLHFIRQGHILIRSSEQYKRLDHTFRADVELGASHMDST